MTLGIVIKATDRASSVLGGLDRRIGAVSSRMMSMGTKSMAAGIGMGYALSKPIKDAMDFESAMADVKKVVNFESPAGLREFGRDITDLSKKIPIAASGLASIAAAGGQLGIAKKDLLGFTQTVAKMGTAFDMAPEQAGDSIAKLMNVYQLGIKEVGSLGDAINHLSDNTAAKASGIVEVLGRVGGTAKQFGLSAKATAALADSFLALGKPPQVAGTAINAMLTKLMTAEKGNKKFKAGLKSLGYSAKQIAKDIQQNPNKALKDFLTRIESVPKEKRMAILVDMFGLEYSDDIALLTGSLDTYRKALGLVADKSKYAGSMQREFESRAATTANKIQLLKNAITAISINIGSLFLPQLQRIVAKIGGVTERISQWAKKNPELAHTIGEIAAKTVVLATGVGAASIAIGLLIKPFGMVAKAGSGLAGMLSKTANSTCGAGKCAGTAAKSMRELGREVGTTRKLFAKPLALTVGLIGAAAVLAGLNAIAQASHTAITDTRSITPQKENLKALQEKEKRLKERLHDAKSGGIIESFLHGSNDQAKTAQLEKLLKRTQRNLAVAKAGSYKKPTLPPSPVSDPDAIAKAKAYSARMHARYDRRPVTVDTDSGSTRPKVMPAVVHPMVNEALVRPKVMPHPVQRSSLNPLPAKDTGKYQAAIETAKAAQAQAQSLQSTVQTIAARPQQHNYHVSVVVNNAKSDQDVEGAVRRALADAHYQTSQRSLDDH